MKKLNMISVAIFMSLAGCVGTGLSPETQAKQAVAFCNSFTGTVIKMTAIRQAGLLDASEIAIVQGAIDTIGPFCTSPQISVPSTTVVSALDTLLVIQLARSTQ